MKMIEGRLDHLEKSMTEIAVKLDLVLNKISAKSLPAPPGLDESSEIILNEVLPRLDLLEKVYVLTDFDAIQQAATTITKQHVEPELELSPEKPTHDPIMEEEVSLEPMTLRFNIYDDKVDKATQSEPLMKHDAGVQSHRSRRIGRAVQTDIAAENANRKLNDKHTTNASTDTGEDTKEADESVGRYIDGEEVEVTPCIIDTSFVKVLMARMERQFDERLAALR
jgi:hypothetical protein